MVRRVRALLVLTTLWSCATHSHQMAPVTVHLVPHSHDDPGYRQTYMGYYRHAVHDIISTMVEALWEDPSRRFIQVEVSFFSLWWSNQTADTRSKVLSLVSEGRLEFVGGGWVMHDEMVTTIDAMANQMTLGLQWLKQELGVRPRHAWQIDPFGHSWTSCNLFQQLGFDSVVINRVPDDEKQRMKETRELQFIWEGNLASDGDTSGIFVHVLDSHYNTPSPKNATPSERADFLLHQVDRRLEWYLHSELLVPFGNDFAFTDARAEFHNMEIVMKLASKLRPEIRFQLSTLHEYMSAVQAAQADWEVQPASRPVREATRANATLPSKVRIWKEEPQYFATHKATDASEEQRNAASAQHPVEERADQPGWPRREASVAFFPYVACSPCHSPRCGALLAGAADVPCGDRDAFWSGFYSTRPAQKLLMRQLDASLHAAEVVFGLHRGSSAGVRARWYAALLEGRRASALMTHHDAITGTSFQQCTFFPDECDAFHDFNRRARAALDSTHKALGEMKLAVLRWGERGVVEEEQGAAEEEQGAAGEEQGAAGKEQGAEGQKQGAVEEEQGAEGQEQGTAVADAAEALGDLTRARSPVRTVVVTVSNPLAWDADEVVDLGPLPLDLNLPPSLRVIDGHGRIVTSQIVTDTTRGHQTLFFAAKGLPALGVRAYFVVVLGTSERPEGASVESPSSNQDQLAPPAASAVLEDSGNLVLQNDRLAVTVDSEGRLTRWSILGSNVTYPLAQQTAAYCERLPDDSGNIFTGGNAYTFVPRSRHRTDGHFPGRSASASYSAGPLVAQTSQEISPGVMQTVRLYTTGPRSSHVELTVISDPKVFRKTFVSHCTDQARGVGGSLAMDILSSAIPAGQAGVCVESNDVADSCHAAPPGSEKVSGAGWFPMVSSASVQGGGMTMRVAANRPMAVSESTNGGLSLLLHRRLDDPRDVRVHDHHNVQDSLMLMLHPSEHVPMEADSKRLTRPVTVHFFTTTSPWYTWGKSRGSMWVPLQREFPHQVHLVSLQAQQATSNAPIGVRFQLLGKHQIFSNGSYAQMPSRSSRYRLRLGDHLCGMDRMMRTKPDFTVRTVEPPENTPDEVLGENANNSHRTDNDQSQLYVGHWSLSSALAYIHGVDKHRPEDRRFRCNIGDAVRSGVW